MFPPGCSIPVVYTHGVGADRVRFPAARLIFNNQNIFMDFIGKVMESLVDGFTALAKAIWPVVTKLVLFFCWILLAILVLPCVFVAQVLYPVWEKWGEKF